MSLVARRYAESLFSLAVQAGCVASLGKKLSALFVSLKESSDWSDFIANPVFSARDQLKVVDALANHLGLHGKGSSGLLGDFLKVLALKKRLSILFSIIQVFEDRAASMQGYLFVDVVSAYSLDKIEKEELKTLLFCALSKNIILNLLIDPTILGGLIVRVGSHQIDASLRTQLSLLKFALKEVS
jgi:F-type H+-transporting ATPase subunit delta